MIEHTQLLFALTLLPLAALVAWIFWMLPLWSRPGIFFAVTVIPSFPASQEGQRVLSGYRAHAIGNVVIAFALIWAGGASQRFAFLVIGMLWLVAGPLVAISRAHGNALAHAMPVSTIREAALAPLSGRLPGGWMVQIGPYAMLLVTAAYIQAHWSEIPERFPVHWGADGMPNGWSTRTSADVFAPLFFGAALVTLISLLAYGIAHAARRIPPVGGGSGKSDPAHRISVVMVGVEFFLAAVFSMVALLPFTGSPGLAVLVIPAVAILACAMFLRSWLAHRGDSAEAAQHDGTPDDCWKLGLFYFNPDDSALFVEKRIGIGYTLNFARAASWILMALALFVPLGLGAFSIWKH